MRSRALSVSQHSSAQLRPLSFHFSLAQHKGPDAVSAENNWFAAANRHNVSARDGDSSCGPPLTESLGVNIAPSRPSHLPWQPFDKRSCFAVCQYTEKTEPNTISMRIP